MASNPYAALLAATSAAPHGGGKGVGGFLENLGNDVRDSAVGLPAGLLHMAEHPISSVEAMGKSTWQDWSPLFHGHVGEFAHNFYAHPLAPILDVASVLTGGGAIAGKLAKMGLDSGLVAEGSAAGKLAKFSKSEGINFDKGGTAPSWAKNTSANPVTKSAQLAIHKVINDVSPHLPGWLGDAMTPEARYHRLEVKMMSPRAAALKYQVLAFVHAGKLLNGPDAMAYRRQILEHSYNQGTHMGREWNLSKPLPADWVWQKAEPGKVAGHDAAQQQFNMHAAKQKGIVSAYSKQHGVIITNPAHARSLLKDTNAQLKTAKASMRPYNHLRVRSEMLQNYLSKNAEMNTAAKALGVKQTATNAARAKFFKPNADNIEGDMAGFAKRYTTNKVGNAKRITKSTGVIVPNHLMEKFGAEGAGSSRFLKMVNSNPVRVWKFMLQGASPGFLTHTAVGNFFMYAMHHGGSAGFRGFMDALGQVKGQPSVAHFFDGIAKAKAGRESVLNPGFIDKNFKDQLNNTLAHGSGVTGKLYKYSMYPLMHAIGDQFLRRATIHAEMRGAPEVQALMKKGMPYHQAADKALSGTSGAAREASRQLRERVSQSVTDTMGDYHSLNKGERGLAAIMPFYTWNRHALRFTKAAFRDDPAKLDFAAKTSNQGVQETVKALGNLPSYLLGSVPLSMLGLHAKGGRLPIASTTSLNPLSTAPDMLDALRSLTGSPHGIRPGEAVGNQLGPVLGGVIQYLSGTNLQTGVPVKNKSIGGLPGNIITQTGQQLPWGDLIKKLVSGNPQPKPNAQTGKTTPFLFEKNKLANISSILGVPIKYMDPAAAQKQYDRQFGIKHGRKSKSQSAYDQLVSASN